MKRFIKTLSVRRWIVSALVCICAFSLSAQTYYRVHKDEFNLIAKYLDYKDLFFFVIASPEDAVAMSSEKFESSQTSISSIDVSISDDQEVLKSKVKGEKKGFNIVPSDGGSDLYNLADSASYAVLGVLGNNYSFMYYSDPDAVSSTSSADFKVIFDSQNDGIVQIKSGLKNADVSILAGVNNKDENIFSVRAEEYSNLSLYRLDFFDWTIDDSRTAEENSIILTSTPNVHIKPYRPDIYLHYILNDGDEVTLEDLIKANNMVSIPKFDDEGRISISIPTNEIVSRASDENTTLWALPVYHDDNGDLVPAGKVITKKYADDGVSTGIVIAVEDAEAQEPVYYTLDGRQAAMPLASGVYVRRIGDKADKVVIR